MNYLYRQKEKMKTFPLLLLFFTFLACAQETQEIKQSNAEIVTTIDSLTNAWHHAASISAITPYLDAMDSVSVFIGTDISEIWQKEQFAAFATPYFQQGKGWDFEVLQRNCYVAKAQNVVWFDESLNTWMGLCRGSGIWEKAQDEWKLKQYVLSVAIPNENIKAVIAAKKSSDSAYFYNHKIRPKYRK